MENQTRVIGNQILDWQQCQGLIANKKTLLMGRQSVRDAIVVAETTWEEATETLRKSLERCGIAYDIDPGEGVFYGPKIDTKIEDALGRAWQGPTVQVDFNLPQCFDVNYIGEDGQEHMVAMVHRTVLGSMERFLASLIENYGGAFPVWLSPVQARIIPVSDRHLDYARKLETELKSREIRAEVDDRSERINLKIILIQKYMNCILIFVQ